MTFFVRFSIRGISPERGLIKLHRQKISVYNVVKRDKDRLCFSVKRKEEKKVIAIFASSCYNIEKDPPQGWAKALHMLKERSGFLVGALCSFLAIALMQTLVLRVEVEGGGAREGEIRAILAENGVRVWRPYTADGAALSVEVLSVRDVSFCSVYKEGFVVYAKIGLRSAEGERAEAKPLLSDCDGVVESIVVLSGTPAVSVGDAVKAGDVLVLPQDEAGSAVPSARVSILCTAYGDYFELLLLTGGDHISLEREGDVWCARYRRIQSIYFS